MLGKRIMTDLKQRAKDKAAGFTHQVTSDQRWRLEDELMCQVFGFTLYGYTFGVGRVHCFMDVEDIHAIIVDELAGLGIGRKYVEGLVQAAHQEFITKKNQSWENQLIGVGHSHALKENMDVLVDSVFSNAAALRKATARPWWKFWSC
jgi:hypothetical protein